MLFALQLPECMEALLIALATPMPRRRHMGIPALLWGAPGTGKSSFVESLARPDFPVVTIIGSIHDPTDFSGIPVHRDGRAHFAPPFWVDAFQESGQGILFLDELSTAPPAVQAALLRVVLERRVGAVELPEGVRVIAAANPPEEAADGWDLARPLANRFLHLRWEIAHQWMLEAMEKGFPRPEVPKVDRKDWEKAFQETISLIRRHQEVFLPYVQPSRRYREMESEWEAPRFSNAWERYAYPSYRTLDYLAALLATAVVLGKASFGKTVQLSGPVFHLIHGTVGIYAGKTFDHALRAQTWPEPEAVLDGKRPLPKGLRGEEVVEYLERLRRVVLQSRRRQKARLARFLRILVEVGAKHRDLAFPVVRKLVRDGVLQRHAQDPEIRESIQQLEVIYEAFLRRGETVEP